MSSRVEYLEAENVILSVVDGPIDNMVDDAPKVEALFNAATKPFIHIVDITNAQFTLDSLTTVINQGSRQIKTLRHPLVKEVVVVTNSTLAAMAARGMNSPIFGHIKTRTCKTLEEALEYARHNL